MKEYTRPELEITEFELVDVIANPSLGELPIGSGDGKWY